MIEIPFKLRHSIESGECVLFLGAGIGAHLISPGSVPAPDAEQLAKEIADHFSINTDGDYDLAKVSQLAVIRHGRTDLEGFLQERLSGLEPDEHILWLLSNRWKAIYTTNYDRGIQRAYELIKDPPQNPITIAQTKDIVSFDSRFDVPVYHLHGVLFGPEKSHIVITEDDYAHFREARKMLFEQLKIHSATSTILYIGYSNKDPNWKLILSEIAAEFSPSPMPKAYRIANKTSIVDKEILKARNIDSINSTFEEFALSGASLIEKETVDKDKFIKLKSNVPTDLQNEFDRNPVPVIRLLSSWTYVNQANFTEASNISDFLRGDRANWALVGSRDHFERDIEEEIYDELLDFATSAATKPKAQIVLGPAGYGVSTLLMSLASKLVKDKAGRIFMLKPGQTIQEGDIEFASSLFKERVFFSLIMLLISVRK